MSDMDDLISLLLPKTLEGKVAWKFQGDDRIVTVQGNNVIEVMYDDFISQAASIVVRNKDGIIIIHEAFAPPEISFRSIEQIFSKVKRSSLKVDETLLDLSRRLRAL